MNIREFVKFLDRYRDCKVSEVFSEIETAVGRVKFEAEFQTEKKIADYFADRKYEEFFGDQIADIIRSGCFE